MLVQNKSLSALLQDMQDEFGRYVYLRRDLRCRANQKEKAKRLLIKLRQRRSFAGIKIKQFKDYDGLRLCLADGSWILFRLSGTEPLLRIYAESDSQAKTKSLITTGVKGVG